MSPRYEHGELIYCEGRGKPRYGDYVVVELNAVGPDPEQPAYLKKLIRISETTITLEQFNPPLTFDLAREKVLHIYRVMTLADLLG